MKRIFYILLTPFLVGIAGFYLFKNILLPQLESLVIEKVSQYSEEKLPVHIQLQKFEIRLFPLSAHAENVTLIPQDKNVSFLGDMEAKKIEMYFDFGGLLSGQIRLSGILIDQWKMRMQVDPLLEGPSRSDEIPAEKIFSVLNKIPIQKILLNHGTFTMESQKWKSHFEFNKASLFFEKGKGALGLKAQSGDFIYTFNNSDSVHGSLDLLGKVDPQEIHLTRVLLNIEKGYIQSSLRLFPLKNLLKSPQLQLKVESFVPMGIAHAKLPQLWKTLHLPTFEGEIRFAGNLDLLEEGNKTGHLECTTKNVKFDKISIGDAAIQGDYKNNELIFSEVLLLHPSGRARLTHSKIKMNANLDFSTFLEVPEMDIQKLFLSLDLKTIPVDAQLTGKLSCLGKVLEDFSLTCDGGIQSQGLHIRSEKGARGTTIVKVDSMSAEGKVQVNKLGVQYNAHVHMPDSHGSSEGEVLFEKGFNIKFKTEDLDFKNIQNLVNLNFRGHLALEGSTRGDSNHGIFDMKIQSKNFGIEQFELGHLNLNLSYSRGNLDFNNLRGTLGGSHYQGQLGLDLTKENIKGQIQFQELDLKDIAFATDKLLHIPVSILGGGKGDLNFSGPLDFWKLNYEWRSEFGPGEIAGERFDLLQANVNGQNGNMQMDEVYLKKGSAQLSVQGKIGSDKEMDLNIDGTGWRLEDTTKIHQISPNILGNLHWAAVVQGPVAEPFFQIKGQIADTVIEDQELADSTLELQATRELFWGKLSLFDKRVDAVFSVPLESKTSELSLKARIDNFGYTQLLALVGGSALIGDYDSNMTGSLDLRSKSGLLEELTGQINIERLYLRRRNLFIGNVKPILIDFYEGQIKVKDFQLDGNSSSLSLRSLANSHLKENKFKFEAETDARLWHLFVPFFEDFGGKLSFATELLLSKKGLQVLGQANLSQMFVKVKGVPHPFEKIQGEISFSQSRANITSLKGSFAGGKIDVEGHAQFEGLRTIPVQLKVNLREVHLNIPDKVHSNGNGDFLISGHWFPYTLAGNYEVTSGLIDKEFADESSSAQAIKRSVYLPREVKESQFEPLLLDLGVNFEKGILMKNSIVDGELTGKIQVKGIPTNPSLVGKVQLEKKSKLLFKDKIFEIQSAVVEFNSAEEINPELYITAQSRVQDYDLTLLVQGMAKSPQFKLSSIPTLSDKDIISLLALGMTSSDLDQKGQSGAQAQQTGVEVTNQLLKTIKLDRKVKEATGWTLQVTSQLDSTKSITVPKAIASKKLAEKLNASIAVGADQSREVKLQYLIDTNLSTVGSYEERRFQEGTTGSKSFDAQSRGYFGIDLEFKREFK